MASNDILTIEVHCKVRWWVKPATWIIQRLANLIAKHGVDARAG